MKQYKLDQQKRIQAYHEEAHEDYLINGLKGLVLHVVKQYRVKQSRLYHEIDCIELKSEKINRFNTVKSEVQSNYDKTQKDINKVLKLLNKHHKVTENNDAQLRGYINNFRNVNCQLVKLKRSILL